MMQKYHFRFSERNRLLGGGKEVGREQKTEAEKEDLEKESSEVIKSDNAESVNAEYYLKKLHT
jgi:hypothetical protein